MALFGFAKKKEKTASCCAGGQKENASCACGAQNDMCEDKDARFIVLGACCQKSTETFENVKQAVSELGLRGEVQNIGDAIKIAQYGVMQTPALVIDNKVVSYGKRITVEEAKSLLSRKLAE